MARYNIDLNPEEKRLIESCRQDMEWQSLSFGAQLKILILRKAQEYMDESSKSTE